MNRELARLNANLIQQNKAIERLARIAQNQQVVGVYQGYNASTGEHTVLIRQNGVDRPIRGRLTTNAGLAAGDRVAVSQGRSTNWFKAQPR